MSDLKIFTDNIEPQAKEQIYTLIKQPAFSNCKVRIMPDVHAGVGCVIGFTADLGDKVIPNIVGVDLGCGMLTVRLSNIDIDFEKLDKIIRNNVPSGRNVHKFATTKINPQSLFCYDQLTEIDWIERSMGTLGGGNHFIEIDVDESDNKYLIIHTGSRNLGKQVADIYQRKAIEYCHGKKAQKAELIAEYKKAVREKEINDALKSLKGSKIPKDLCYLEGKDREEYLHDMRFCQDFAQKNRLKIANTIVHEMGWTLKVREAFETVHNYIAEDNIVRKGAISAQKGEKVLIPINMRDGCIIGYGLGNQDWNCSAPHGAGRLMSRSKAKEIISLSEFENSMNGIYTTSVSQSTIDESPMAYKPISEIIRNISDTVEIQEIIKPVYNFKASE